MSNGFDPSKFDPHDPGFLRDPYPTYKEFREHEPIYRVPRYEADWLFRYADCLEVLSNKDVWLKNPEGAPQTPVYGPYGLLVSNFPAGMFNSDPNKHELIRGAVEPDFVAAILNAEGIAETRAPSLLAEAAKRGWFELIDDYALPLPAQVLFTLLGIPNGAAHPGVWEVLIGWQALIAAAHDITQSPQVRMTGATSSMAVISMFEAMLLEKPSKAGLFGKIVKAFKKAGLSDQDVQIWGFDFVVAGYLSTTFLIGNGTRNLLLHPDQLRLLREKPKERMLGAIEEMMRYDGPVQIVDCMAAQDTEVGGHKFNKYDKVIAVVGSANRDEDKFKEPDRFLIGRGAEAEQHLGFGWGIHHCIGQPLVRLVAPVAFRMLLEKFPNLALAGQAQWKTDPYLRAVTNLPLQF